MRDSVASLRDTPGVAERQADGVPLINASAAGRQSECDRHEPRKREVIVSALGSELKIDVAETDSRGHAADLAAQARADEFDLVIAVGGDGTVNEVVTGLLREGVGPTPRASR